MNLGTYRLSAFKIGRRQYAYPTLTPEDLRGVREAVVWGLGMGHLLKTHESSI